MVSADWLSNRWAAHRLSSFEMMLTVHSKSLVNDYRSATSYIHQRTKGIVFCGTPHGSIVCRSYLVRSVVIDPAGWSFDMCRSLMDESYYDVLRNSFKEVFAKCSFRVNTFFEEDASSSKPASPSFIISNPKQLELTKMSRL
jgi:N-acetylglutamate synthase-like GNAT family acetyltransferase